MGVREKLMVPDSDHLTLLNIYLQWKNSKYSDHWCDEYFPHTNVRARDTMRDARKNRQQLLEIMKQIRMDLNSCGHEWDKIRKCICCAYFHNGAKMKGINDY